MEEDEATTSSSLHVGHGGAAIMVKKTVFPDETFHATRAPSRFCDSNESSLQRYHPRKPEKLMTLENLTKEELLTRVNQLDAHVLQLKNIIAKNDAKKQRRPWKNQRPFDFTRYNSRHVALKVVYLGWDYHGFAVQEDSDKTVEAALFDSLLKAKLVESRETSNYHRCGRTDKGVSAFSQVISIDMRTNLLAGRGVKVRENGTAHRRSGDTRTEIRYVHVLNKLLPAEIRVLAWAPVDVDFSARFNCTQRTYKYFFPVGDLNTELMLEAANKLIGEHDYRNLCRMDVGNGVVNFIRKILTVDLQTNGESGKYAMCELTIVGQAFLWHQIRCIVAILFLVGQGQEKPEIISELLDVGKHPKKPQYAMASEIPLVLFKCEFENLDWIYDQECHAENIRHLQELWARENVKSTMMRRMLCDLEVVPTATGEGSCMASAVNNWMTAGSRVKTYRPLLDRQKCESLEERMEHFAKKRKICTQSEETGSEDVDDWLETV